MKAYMQASRCFALRTATDGWIWRSSTRRRGIDAVVADLTARGAKLVGELVLYDYSDRLDYVRSPDGISLELTERIGQWVCRAVTPRRRVAAIHRPKHG